MVDKNEQSSDSNLHSDKNSVGSSKSLSNFSNDVENDYVLIIDSDDEDYINNEDYKSDNSIIEDDQTLDSENANDDLCNAENSCSGTKEIRNDTDEKMEVDTSVEHKLEDDEQMDDKEKDQIKFDQKFIDISAGKKQKSNKNKSTLVIIDKTGRYRLPVGSNTQNNMTNIPQAISKTILNSYNSVQQPQTTNKPLIDGQILIPKQPIILTTRIDDKFVVDAPSFIVPFVHENPPKKPLKEFIEQIKDTTVDTGSDGIVGLTINSDEKETDIIIDKPKIQSPDYFENPFGKFFMEIGANLVQEQVQLDLLHTLRRKRDCEGDKCTEEVHMAISSLIKTLDFSKKNNDPYQFDLKKCELCNFKSESSLVMAHHLETPHMTANHCYGCNFCTFQVCSPHEILQHMETHGTKGHLEKELTLHQCPRCPYKSSKKSHFTRHLISCVKKYRPEINQAPPLDWKPPAKIPKVLGRNPSMRPGNKKVYEAVRSEFTNRNILKSKQQLYISKVPVSDTGAHGRTVLPGQQFPGMMPPFRIILPKQTPGGSSFQNTSIKSINQPMTVPPPYTINGHTYQALLPTIPSVPTSEHSMSPGNEVNQAVTSVFSKPNILQYFAKQKIYNIMVPVSDAKARGHTVLPGQQFSGIVPTFPITLPNQTSGENSFKNISDKSINQPMTVPPPHSINGHTYQAPPLIKPRALKSKNSTRPRNAIKRAIFTGFKHLNTTYRMLQLQQQQYNNMVPVSDDGAHGTVVPGQQFPGMVPTFPTTLSNQTSKDLIFNQPMTVPPPYSINDHTNQAPPTIIHRELTSGEHSMSPGNADNQAVTSVFSNPDILQYFAKQQLYNNTVPVSDAEAHGRTVLPRQQFPGMMPTLPSTLPNQTSGVSGIPFQNISDKSINQPMTVPPPFSINSHTYQVPLLIIPRALQSKYSMRSENGVKQATLTGFKQFNTTPKMSQLHHQQCNKTVSAFGAGAPGRTVLPKQQFPGMEPTFPTTPSNQTPGGLIFNQPMIVPPPYSINSHTNEVPPLINPRALQSKHSTRPGNSVKQATLTGFKQFNTTHNMLQLQQQQYKNMVLVSDGTGAHGTVLPGQQFPEMVPTFPTAPPNQTPGGLIFNQPMTVPPPSSINSHTNEAPPLIKPRALKSKNSTRPRNAVKRAIFTGFRHLNTTYRMLQLQQQQYNNMVPVSDDGAHGNVVPGQQFPGMVSTFPTTLPNQTPKGILLNNKCINAINQIKDQNNNT